MLGSICTMNPMRTYTLAVLCSLALAGVAPLQAQGSTGNRPAATRKVQDPAEYYLTAYRLCRESEQLAALQNYNAAISKGAQAEKVLAGIVKDFPHWKSNLVSTRRRLLAENMATYRRKSAEAPIPTGRQPGRPLATEIELPSSTRPYDPVHSEYRPVELPDYDTTDKRLYNALAAAQEECRKMAAAYRDLNAKYEDSQRQLTSARLEQQMYKDRYEQLQQQVVTERSAGNEVVNSLTQQLAELEAKYRASEEAREKAEARITELESTLAQTQEELARVTRERDALKAENEPMAEKKNTTRAQALTNGIAYANANGDTDTAEVLANMLAQVTKPRKAAVSKARKMNENLVGQVFDLAGDEVTTKDIVALGIAEIATTQKAAAVLRVACELGKFEKVTEGKKVTYKKVIAE